MSESSSLLVNAASGHGLIRWMDRLNAWQDLEQLIGLKSNSLNSKDSSQYQVLLFSTAWFLNCLGVLDHVESFRQGWKQTTKLEFVGSDSYGLGCLCRQGPALIKRCLSEKQTNLNDQAAMFYCYRQLLMNPAMDVGNNVDDYVDDRLPDLQLSEKVYTHNYQRIIQNVILEFNREHFWPNPVVIIDIGAGNGNVLLDVALKLERLGFKCVCIAVDPSSVSRRESTKLFSHYPQFQLYVIDGSVENPELVVEFLESKQIRVRQCLLIAKSSFHDRTFDQFEESVDNVLGQSLSVGDYVYRDSNWKILTIPSLSQHLTDVLNRWSFCFQNSLLIIMESHLIDSSTIQSYIHKVPVLPSFLSHSFSAQYLLPFSDHLESLMKTDFSTVHQYPLHALSGDPLMSLLVAKS